MFTHDSTTRLIFDNTLICVLDVINSVGTRYCCNQRVRIVARVNIDGTTIMTVIKHLLFSVLPRVRSLITLSVRLFKIKWSTFGRMTKPFGWASNRESILTVPWGEGTINLTRVPTFDTPIKLQLLVRKLELVYFIILIKRKLYLFYFFFFFF